MSLIRWNCLLCGTAFLCGRGVATVKCPLCGARNFPRVATSKGDVGALERVLKSTVNQRNARSARKAVLTGWDATVEKLRMHKMQYYSMSSSSSIQESVKHQCEEMRRARSPSLRFYDLSRQRSFFSASAVLGRPNPRQLNHIAETLKCEASTAAEASEDRLKSSQSLSSLASRGVTGTRVYGHTPDYEPFWERSSDLSTGYLHQTRPPSRPHSRAPSPHASMDPSPSPPPRLRNNNNNNNQRPNPVPSLRSISAPPELPEPPPHIDWPSPPHSPQWLVRSYKPEPQKPENTPFQGGGGTTLSTSSTGWEGEGARKEQRELVRVRHDRHDLQRTEQRENNGAANSWRGPPPEKSFSLSGIGMIKAMVESEHSSPALLPSQWESTLGSWGGAQNGAANGRPVSAAKTPTSNRARPASSGSSRPGSHRGAGSKAEDSRKGDTARAVGGGSRPPGLRMLDVSSRNTATTAAIDWRNPRIAQTFKGMKPIKWVTSPTPSNMEPPPSPFQQRVLQKTPQGKASSPFSVNTHFPNHHEGPRSPLSPTNKPNTLRTGGGGQHLVSFSTVQTNHGASSTPQRHSPNRAALLATGGGNAHGKESPFLPPKTPEGLGVGLLVRGEKTENTFFSVYTP